MRDDRGPRTSPAPVRLGAGRPTAPGAVRPRRPNRTGSIRRVWPGGLLARRPHRRRHPYSATGPRRRGPGGGCRRSSRDGGAAPPGPRRPGHRGGLRGPGSTAPAGDRAGARAAEQGNHERAVNLHLLPAIGHLTLAELTAAQLERLYARLLEPPARLAVKTVRDINGTLRLALRRLPRGLRAPQRRRRRRPAPARARARLQYPLRADQMARFARA